MQKLINLQGNHYIVVSDLEIHSGDFFFDTRYKTLGRCFSSEKDPNWLKVTHSTVPLEIDRENKFIFEDIKYLSIREVTTLLYGCPIDESLVTENLFLQGDLEEILYRAVNYGMELRGLNNNIIDREELKKIIQTVKNNNKEWTVEFDDKNNFIKKLTRIKRP